MSSAPPSPESLFPNLNDRSSQVLDPRGQRPVTGEDEYEQSLDRELQSCERAIETVVCFLTISGQHRTKMPIRILISIRTLSACDRSSGAIPIVTDGIFNQLVEMKPFTLDCVSSRIVRTLILLPNYRRKATGVPYDPLVEPVPIVRTSKIPGPTSRTTK